MHKTEKAGIYTALAIAAALISGQNLAVAQPAPATPESVASVSDVDGDARRFCSNIVDAARDRRYALQKSELETLRQDIDRRIAALEKKRHEYEEWLQRRNDFLTRAGSNLVEIYSRMRPDAAAERLSDMDMELAAGILMKLRSQQAGYILNEMDSKAAATLTGIIASAARKQDPV